MRDDCHSGFNVDKELFADCFIELRMYHKAGDVQKLSNFQKLW